MGKQSLFSTLLTLGALAGVCIPSAIVFAANPDIVINEIAAYEPSNCEWVELFNKGAESVNLEGWKFWEGGVNHGLTISSSSVPRDWVIEPDEYAIIAQNDTKLFSNECSGYAVPNGTFFDSSWQTLNEGGEEIGLKDGAGNFLEQFTYVAATNHALERRVASQNDYTAANWVEHSSGNSFGRQNDAAGTSPPPPSSTSTISTGALPLLTINEFLADPVAGEAEWLELYNAATSSVDLSGWTVRDGLGAIAASTGTIAASGFFVIELPSSRLNNDGDAIFLVSASTTMDTVSYGNWDDGNVPNNAPKAAKGNSVARRRDGQDSGNDAADFAETTNATKGGANIINAPAPVAASPTSGGGSAASQLVPVAVGEVVINEMLPDPGDGEEEFVEIYNKINQTISLSGWWVEDGSEAKTMLSGSVAGRGFFVIEKPKGSLNNSGDLVILRDQNGREMDRLSYGDWADGNLYDNAPGAEEGMAVARAIDGEDSNNDARDFVLTTTVTKGRANAITRGAGETKTKTSSPTVVLNELLPNPPGSDDVADGEFIELKNISSTTVDLVGWKITTPLQEYQLREGRIEAGKFLVFPRAQTKLVLHNSGREEVKLLRSDNAVADRVSYGGEAKDGLSYARRGDGRWAWSITSTPGRENIIVSVNAPPVIALDVEREVGVGEEAVFDASDTVDPDGEPLAFVWNFGDGAKGDGSVARHAFARAGVYHLELEVADTAHNTTTQRVVIKAKDRLAFVGGPPSSVVSAEMAKSVRISEIYPNPTDSDSKEFVELRNEGEEDIDISDWQLDDEEGGSRPYVIPESTIIRAGQYLVFPRQDTKLALNNAADAVRLLLPDNTVTQEVTYEDAPEGSAYVLDSKGAWVWTAEVTAGKANTIKNIRNTKNTKIRNGVTATAARRQGTILTLALSDVPRQPVGQVVRVSGAVAVLPGVFGAQYFYIVTSTAGVQIYMHNRAFPSLAIGDGVTVVGEVGEAYGEKRIKVRQAIDIVVHQHGASPSSA
ncbi:MAG: lamin tail domain-containing protein, partial [Candidatus Magasanikbacteria bacterium]|nr:lamin tail domain-containing protein [Candidatus Magasanikbacteria bacterium]